MSPHETFFLTPTAKTESFCKSKYKYIEITIIPNPSINSFFFSEIDNNPYIQFTIKDFPGN